MKDICSFLFAAGGFLAVVAADSARAQDLAVITSEKARFKVEKLAEGLERPWGLVELPDGRLLVTERPGRLRVIENGKLLSEPIRGTPEVWARGQGGLLDIQLHPDYAKNGWIYLAFSDPKDGNALTKIVRGRVKDGAWIDQQPIFEGPADEYTSGGAHFGCRMQFDGQGNLFFSIGDRGDAPKPENNAQQLGNVKGKIHRIRDDGAIPPDNPFANRAGAAKSIWSYGNRNPQGLIFDAKGTLWEVEHGPRGGDELNVIQRGKNYGWPVVTYGINYSGTPITDKTEAPGMEPPVVQWTPSIAVGGLAAYDHDAFPGWRGNLFAAALAHQKLIRIEVDSANRVTHQEILLEKTGRLRDVRTLRDGSLALVYDLPGTITRLVPAE